MGSWLADSGNVHAKSNIRCGSADAKTSLSSSTIDTVWSAACATLESNDGVLNYS